MTFFRDKHISTYIKCLNTLILVYFFTAPLLLMLLLMITGHTWNEYVLCFYAKHTFWEGASLHFLTTIDQH